MQLEFCYNEARPLDGVIAHLTRECCGNVHKKGVVIVTGSSKYVRGECPENVADVGTDSFYCSNFEPNSWVSYDFKERRVAPTSYSVRAHSIGSPRSWVFEVSNDGSEGSWQVVDRRDDTSDFIGQHVSRVTPNFAISARPPGSFRFVRLRQTGKNYTGDDRLGLASLEVFGTLTDIPRPVAGPGEFPFCDLHPLDGIIAHLSRECGGNVHEMGVVYARSSIRETDVEGGRSSGGPREVADLGTDSYLTTEWDTPNPWFLYDFKGRRVAPTSYSIRTDRRWFHIESWVFEVSNDGSEGSWEVIDRRDGNKDMDGDFVTRNFQIGAPPREGYRFVRLRRTEGDGREWRMDLTSLEIFGTLTDTPRPVALPGEFPFYDLRPLNGIIAHLTRECGGNVHKKGVVEVTASSLDDSLTAPSETNAPENVAELGSYEHFYRSKHQPNQWIRYDFKNRRVAPTSYSVCGGGAYPTSWVFEVSNDGSEESWEIIDRRDDGFVIDEYDVTRNFTVSAPPRGSFRFVRFRQIQGCSTCLTLTSFEVFGTLSPQ